MELKAPGRLAPFAEELAPRVPSSQRELFLIGAGVRPGGAALVETALARAHGALELASPAAALEKLRCPLFVCHGVDDDVIPWNEAEKLYRAAAGPARLLLTRLYGHTTAARPNPVALAREAGTLIEMMHALATGGVTPRPARDRRARR
jgi:pimeloyl-ACP methyl ester carboxylesterase